MTGKVSIGVESPSIQTHLSVMQGVIQRMASNSASSKAWCVTLVSAVLVIVADKGKPQYSLIAFLPIVMFAALDVYYLALENSFRSSYNSFVSKLCGNNLSEADLYSVAPSGSFCCFLCKAISSFSVWGFYVPLALLVMLAKRIAIG